MNQVVDLRSDTVTRPTRAMREVMMHAPLGDDVYGDDPSVNELQDKIAGMLGFEAALFLPTGTQSNLCAILSQCQRGDEYIVGQFAHTYRWEAGGAAVLGSVQPQPIPNAPDGSLRLQDIDDAIKPDDPHFAISRLLCLENTIGGKVLPFDYVQEATALARTRGINTHLDGARLFNAAVTQSGLAEGESAERALAEARKIAGCFDSVSVCFSKGLGAPVGSALCGSKDQIARAFRIRKMAGGAMRQAGVLASAATYALDHHVARMAEDHRRAKRLAAAFGSVDGAVLDPVHSNMVFVDLQGPAKERAEGFVAYLESNGILSTGLYRLRFVTHLDVDDAGIDRACEVIAAYFA